jgi:hypothetical protein
VGVGAGREGHSPSYTVPGPPAQMPTAMIAAAARAQLTGFLAQSTNGPRPISNLVVRPTKSSSETFHRPASSSVPVFFINFQLDRPPRRRMTPTTAQMSHQDPDSERDERNDADSAWEAEDELEDASSTIGLGRMGETGSGYRIRNDPTQPFQRQTIIEQRGGLIEARCQSVEIVHGALSPDSDEWATLLVYAIHLDTTKRSRRIISATVKFEFSTPGGRSPRLHNFAPSGRLPLLRTTRDETIVRGVGASVSSGAVIVDAGLSANWEKTISHTASDEARISGTTLSDDFGRRVGACWTLSENSSIKSGVPSQLRCAMLLARDDDTSPFQCKVTIQVQADWKSALSKLFGTTPVDDPVLFDPSLKPTNKLRKSYDTDHLDHVDLEEIVLVRF